MVGPGLWSITVNLRGAYPHRSDGEDGHEVNNDTRKSTLTDKLRQRNGRELQRALRAPRKRLLAGTVSWGCCNKAPQTYWLETTWIYDLTLLEVRSLNGSHRAAVTARLHPFPQSPGGTCFLAFSRSWRILRALAQGLFFHLQRWQHQATSSSLWL